MNLWIDLDNSPHVLLFAPIARELQRRGANLIITVREFSQTRELAQQHGLSFTTVGRHYGSSAAKVVKVAGTFYRAASLARFIARHRILAAVSHGSRAMVLAAYALRRPVMTLYDYEFASYRLYNMLSDRILAPEVIPDDRLIAQGLDLRKLVRYPGLKEEVYVYGFHPDLGLMGRLGLDRKKLIVTLRPPATWAHYHHERSQILFAALMNRLKREPDVQVVIPARTEAQARELKSTYGLDDQRFLIFTQPVDALSLMWCSDVVFSGGGTMTREAALLGLNVYSIFGGRLGAGDESLIRQGKLKLLRQPEEIDLLTLTKREIREHAPEDCKQLASHLAGEIVRFAQERRR